MDTARWSVCFPRSKHDRCDPLGSAYTPIYVCTTPSLARERSQGVPRCLGSLVPALLSFSGPRSRRNAQLPTESVACGSRANRRRAKRSDASLHACLKERERFRHSELDLCLVGAKLVVEPAVAPVPCAAVAVARRPTVKAFAQPGVKIWQSMRQGALDTGDNSQGFAFTADTTG